MTDSVVQSVARALSIDPGEAEQWLRGFAAAWRDRILLEGRITLEGLGSFVATGSGVIFEPDAKLLAAAWAGLDNLPPLEVVSSEEAAAELIKLGQEASQEQEVDDDTDSYEDDVDAVAAADAIFAELDSSAATTTGDTDVGEETADPIGILDEDEPELAQDTTGPKAEADVSGQAKPKVVEAIPPLSSDSPDQRPDATSEASALEHSPGDTKEVLGQPAVRRRGRGRRWATAIGLTAVGIIALVLLFPDTSRIPGTLESETPPAADAGVTAAPTETDIGINADESSEPEQGPIEEALPETEPEAGSGETLQAAAVATLDYALGGYTLIVASFPELATAESEVERFRSMVGRPDIPLEVMVSVDGTFHRVAIGQRPTLAEVQSLKEELTMLPPDAWVLRIPANQ